MYGCRNADTLTNQISPRIPPTYVTEHAQYKSCDLVRSSLAEGGSELIVCEENVEARSCRGDFRPRAGRANHLL